MAWYDFGRALWSSELAVPPSVRESSVMTAAELIDGYDLVIATDDSIVVTPRTKESRKLDDSGSSSMQELGYAAPSPWTSWTRREYNTTLAGQNGLKVYDQMRRSDSTVRASLRLVKTPIWSARWFVEPASKSVADQNIADFVWWNMTQRMTYGFDQILEEALLMLDFGWYAFEKVWVKDVWKGRDVICWGKLAPRHPQDVQFWEYDKNGGPNKIVMYPNPAQDVKYADEIAVPIDKLISFTYQKEAGNMEGMSLLRPVYKHWYYKTQMEKIDAIQKERHSIGIPVIILPPNFSPNDKVLAEELGSNLRTNDRAHVVLPPLWEIKFAEVKSTGLADPMDTIKHHDLQIQKNILAPFMDAGLKEDETGFFLKNARDIATVITRNFNDYAIKQLVDKNYLRLPNGYPKLRARRIGEEQDWRTMSFAVRNMIGAGAIIPDDVLEAFLRDLMDLPVADEATARIIQQPQMAGGGKAAVLSLPNAPATPVPNTPAGSINLPPGVKSNTPAAPGLPRVGPPRQKSATSGLALPPRPHGGSDRSGGR